MADTLPPEYLDHEKLNLELNRMHRIAEDIIIHAINKKYPDPVRIRKKKPSLQTMTPANWKQQSQRLRAKEKVNLNFFFQMQQYIESKEGTVAIGTMHVFKNLKLILETFEAHRKKPITFDTIDLDFYEEFIHYLTFEHIHIKRKNRRRDLK